MSAGEIRRFLSTWYGLYLLMAKKNILTVGKKRKADEAANRGDRLTAQTLYASVCKLDPLDVEAWIKLSLIEKELGNYPQAERCARRALVLNTQFGYAHYALGQALHSQFQRVDAIASYRAATGLMPDFPDAHYPKLWLSSGPFILSWGWWNLVLSNSSAQFICLLPILWRSVILAMPCVCWVKTRPRWIIFAMPLIWLQTTWT